jgi:hypothetical protein
MIGWIPFRAPSLDYTFTVWSHLVDPSRFVGLGLRESTYVVAAATLLVTIAAPFAGRAALALAGRAPVAARPLLLAGWSLLLMLVIIYLRPISQFIYFQF